jgi:hypothetical protein
MLELRLYPSGFRGSAKVADTAPIDAERNRERFFNTSAIIQHPSRPASLEIAQIWQIVTSGSAEMKTFEFHERVIKAALEHFGTPFIYDWIEDQRKSPNWDEWHCRWVDEMLQFVVDGKAHQLSPFNWASLLASKGQYASPDKDSAVVCKYFFEHGACLAHNTTIVDFIHQWLQRPGGFEDLTEALYVLFGPR